MLLLTSLLCHSNMPLHASSSEQPVYNHADVISPGCVFTASQIKDSSFEGGGGETKNKSTPHRNKQNEQVKEEEEKEKNPLGEQSGRRLNDSPSIFISLITRYR